MLALFSTALGANVLSPFLRSCVRKAFNSADSSVQSMLSPVVPQADDPGTSPELNAAGPAVSVQAHPGPPILQGHPGDATDVTTLAELASVSGTDAGQPVLAELATATDGTGAEQTVLAESRAGTADGTDDELSPGEKVGGEEQGGDIYTQSCS